MKKVFGYLKNKYVLATVILAGFSLFLDENDIFTILNQRYKLQELEKSKVKASVKLNETLITLKKLDHISEVERFAREHKYFKKDDEDIFVIFYE